MWLLLLLLTVAWRRVKVKAEVLELAEFERGGVVLAKSRLEVEWRRKKMGDGEGGGWGLSVDVTDLYGQMYVARDIARRMK